MLPTTHTTHIVRKGNKLLELTQKQVVYECRIGLAFNIAKDDMQTSRLVGVCSQCQYHTQGGFTAGFVFANFREDEKMIYV